MADTYTLHLQNFRSIRDAKIDIAPLTVIYGPNGSGKSSLIYGLLTLKNFPDQPQSEFRQSLCSYPSISLGGLQEVVHRHDIDRGVSLSMGVSNSEELSSEFTLTLSQSGGESKISFDEPQSWRIQPWPDTLNMQVPIPYRGDQQVEHEIIQYLDERAAVPLGTLNWNGVTLSANLTHTPDEGIHSHRRINQRSNLPMELARSTGFVPIRRGFSKPTYGLSSVTPALATEDEVASLLASPTERFRQYEVSRYAENIVNRRVQVQAQIGTSAFTIDTIPIDGGVPASIVNEGFGINQLVYMLTICLYSPFKIVAIEEPEIHLHPSLVRKLAHAMVEITANGDRRLIVSTHSETFVVALLAQIAAGNASVDDVSFILAENRDGESVFTQQAATRDGQIKGGLAAFMEAEVADLALFLDAGNNKAGQGP